MLSLSFFEYLSGIGRLNYYTVCVIRTECIDECPGCNRLLRILGGVSVMREIVNA
ncbi:hypothetical protein D3C81_2253620 [compost metagenome]